MKKTILVLAFFMFQIGVFAQDVQTFGDVKVNKELAIAATEIPSKLKEVSTVEDLTVTGQVKGVCQAKGCWMTMDLGNGKEMTVKFKDYAFFMPMDCAGKNVVFHGKAFTKTTSVAELKHLAEDAGKSKKEIKKIKKPQLETRFEADGVMMY
jgi:hypothetical protein